MDGTDDMLWNGSEEDGNVNTFAAKDDHSRFKNPCFKLPKTTIVDLFFNRARSALSA
jgi:hypothetical protein